MIARHRRVAARHLAPRTPVAFCRAAERWLRRSYPTAEISWLDCERVTWPDKSRGFSGTLLVKAPGLARSKMLATLGQNRLEVR